MFPILRQENSTNIRITARQENSKFEELNIPISLNIPIGIIYVKIVNRNNIPIQVTNYTSYHSKKPKRTQINNI